ncbi:hypothetical protein G6F42_012151 [Rhizopus arrhizus]|nr:hypothetical protein G6F42_012151 [Rhizopus arrhizus]
MGQDQSNPVGAKLPPPLTPSTSTSTNKRSLYNIAHQQQSDESEVEGSSTIEETNDESDVDQGIIQVVSGPEDTEEEQELVLLRKIQKFEPFIQEQDKGFSIEHLLGLKSKESKSKNHNKEVQDPLLDIFFGLQAHIKEQMSHINLEQRILLKRITYVDELSTASAQTMAAAFNQAKLAADKVSEAVMIKEQAEKAQNYTIDIFKALSKLEQYLDPEDRILATNDINSKWPVLNQLRIKASKSTDVPLLERYISSTSDMTTVGTSTSPLIEKVIVTGEPAIVDGQHMQIDTSNTRSTSTSSLALNRLRGLSPKSITKTSNSES